MKARHFLLTAGLVLVLGCGGNGGNGQEDIIPDPQPEQDVTPDPVDDEQPVEIPEEEAPVEPAKACVLPCASEAECCITTASCGTYPDKWTCGGTCELGGCADNAECIDWATRRGFPSPETYACRGYAGATARCVSACSTEADCCPSGDCTTYPGRYVCDTGNCFLSGCIDDNECKTWAAGRSLHMASSYVCRQPLGGGIGVCAQGCTTADECCPPEAAPCTMLPSHFSCTDNICMLTCSTDDECRSFAAASSYPHAESYSCREM